MKPGLSLVFFHGKLEMNYLDNTVQTQGGIQLKSSYLTSVSKIERKSN